MIFVGILAMLVVGYCFMLLTAIGTQVMTQILTLNEYLSEEQIACGTMLVLSILLVLGYGVGMV